jgi:DNA polymerase elongation subunit (family B)
MKSFYTNVYYDFDSILISERESDGSKKFRTEKFTPSLFISSNKQTDFKSIDGKYLSEMTFDSYSSFKEFKEKYSAIPGFEIHGDINAEYQFINKGYGTNVQYSISTIDMMYIDIETSSENGFPSIEDPNEEVIAISLTSTIHGKATFCLGMFKTTENIKVFEFQDEQSLLKSFITYFSDNYPDIITGWNIRFFDIPYLVKRINKILGKKQSKLLSPWGIIKEKYVTKQGKEEICYDLIGISSLDYYELYKTFTYVNQESYSLNHISYVELGEKKLSYSEYESITEFYKKDFQKFIEYNIRDVELVQKLEEKLKLMELAIALAYSAGVNYQDVFSQVRTWDVIIYNYLSEYGIVIPPKKKEKKNVQYAGAYVKEPIVGMHSWVVSFDLNSLYPHLIMQFNISPETLTDEGMRGVISPEGILKGGMVSSNFIKEFKQKNLSIAANGTTYRKDIRGFLPELMEKMYEDRKMFKKKMIDTRKELEKIEAEIKRRGLTK